MLSFSDYFSIIWFSWLIDFTQILHWSLCYHNIINFYLNSFSQLNVLKIFASNYIWLRTTGLPYFWHPQFIDKSYTAHIVFTHDDLTYSPGVSKYVYIRCYCCQRLFFLCLTWSWIIGIWICGHKTDHCRKRIISKMIHGCRHQFHNLQ